MSKSRDRVTRTEVDLWTKAEALNRTFNSSWHVGRVTVSALSTMDFTYTSLLMFEKEGTHGSLGGSAFGSVSKRAGQQLQLLIHSRILRVRHCRTARD